MKETCRETLERAYLFLDNELLTAQERDDIRVHLEACAPCYERYGLEQQVAEVVARLKHANQCPEGLRRRINELLRYV
jgi:mycothiol system anti-sigma-R factor